ncbi:MAG: T9SS type A sorting domain-containing protein [Polyangiaceae bacterium]|nr:T9SS type A sorting domain-containing protein [Polyangiaceae bacterium]
MRLSMRLFLLLLAFITLPEAADAQTPVHVWSAAYGGDNTDYVNDIAVDAAGNAAIIGTFVGMADFGGSPLLAAGYDDIYVARYDPAGNHLWSQAFGNSNYEAGNGIAADSDGNVIITGCFVDAVDFGGAPLVSDGGCDVFLAKFDPMGNHLWSQRFGTDAENEGADRVATDGAGNILFAGSFEDSIDFGGGPLVIPSGSALFLAKLDPNGSHLWSRGFEHINSLSVGGIAVDRAGNVLMVGDFWGTVDFGGGPITSMGDSDIYLAKFDLDGGHVWSMSFGNLEDGYGQGVAVDGAGHVLITGYFDEVVDFGGGPLVSSGQEDVFIAEFDPDGYHLWSRSFGASGRDTGQGIAVAGSGSVFITGSFNGTVDFGGDPFTSAGLVDIYAAMFDSNGGHLWSQRFGGSEIDRGKGVATDAAGNILLTGFFQDFVNFGGSTLHSAGESDIYLAKLDCQGTDSPVPPDPCALAVRAYPNPFNPSTTLSYTLPAAGIVKLRLYDLRGRLVEILVDGFRAAGEHDVAWDGRDGTGSVAASGVFLARLELNGEAQVRKVVLVK